MIIRVIDTVIVSTALTVVVPLAEALNEVTDVDF